MNTNLFHKVPLSFWLIVVVISCLVLSYVPVLTLGVISGIHVDISLLYILCGGAIMVSLPRLWLHRQMLWRLVPMRLLGAFIVFVSISILWSPNPIRAAVTVAFLWLIFLLMGSVIVHSADIRKHRRLLLSCLAIAFGITSLWSLWQIFGDALGVSAAFTALPVNYQSAVFGVARPTGFALEPQFLGSLLLVPFCWSLERSLKRRSWHYDLVLGGLSALLILTLSRGAIGAAVVAGGLLLLLCEVGLKRRIWSVGTIIVGIFAALLLQYAAGSVYGHSAQAGSQAVRSSINQLSFGKLAGSTPSIPAPPATSKSFHAYHSGYVSSSTTSRVSMASYALKSWSQSPNTVLFGVGIGGFGANLHKRYPTFSGGTVANNYYLEMLAETGVIGFGLFISFLASMFYITVRSRQWLLLASLAAFSVQWWFFSGNANVLHIWVFMAIILAYSLHWKNSAVRQ